MVVDKSRWTEWLELIQQAVEIRLPKPISAIRVSVGIDDLADRLHLIELSVYLTHHPWSEN